MKGKALSNYKGGPTQLSFATSDLVNTGETKVVKPVEFNSLADLKAQRNEMNNRLVKVNGVQFSGWKEGHKYNPKPGDGTFHSTLEMDATTGTSGVSAETSKYAPWINDATPGGNGSITGVFVASNSFNNIWYRTLDDIQFTGARK